jgi:hypothetical protein
MSEGAGLPSKRWSLRGYDDEGNEVWLIRSFGQKLYRCPGYVLRGGGTEHHHWHRQCAEEMLTPDLREVKKVPASQSSRSKLEERGRRPSGRRRRS